MDVGLASSRRLGDVDENERKIKRKKKIYRFNRIRALRRHLEAEQDAR